MGFGWGGNKTTVDLSAISGFCDFFVYWWYFQWDLSTPIASHYCFAEVSVCLMACSFVRITQTSHMLDFWTNTLVKNVISESESTFVKIIMMLFCSEIIVGRAKESLWHKKLLLVRQDLISWRCPCWGDVFAYCTCSKVAKAKTGGWA